MISFSIDKQRGKVNAEWMSRPVDSIKKSKIDQPLVSVLISMEQSPTFAYRLKRKLLSGPIIGGAYTDIAHNMILESRANGQKLSVGQRVIKGSKIDLVVGTYTERK